MDELLSAQFKLIWKRASVENTNFIFKACRVTAGLVLAEEYSRQLVPVGDEHPIYRVIVRRSGMIDTMFLTIAWMSGGLEPWASVHDPVQVIQNIKRSALDKAVHARAPEAYLHSQMVAAVGLYLHGSMRGIYRDQVARTLDEICA